jgi:hypothetical protein
LNPIENIWFVMKDWVEHEYDIQTLKQPELRAAIGAAWEAIPEDFFLDLSHSMIERLTKVIAANG